MRKITCRTTWQQTLSGFTAIVLCVAVVIWPLVAAGSSQPNPNKSIDFGEPIDARTRSYYFYVPIFDLGGPLPVHYEMVYESVSNFEPGMKAVVAKIDRVGENALYVQRWGDGRVVVRFSKTSENIWESDNYSTYQYGLQEETGAYGWFYLMDPSDQTVYIFKKDGSADDSGSQMASLRYHLDCNGNRVSYAYDNDWRTTPTSISDDLGREIIITNHSNHTVHTVGVGTRLYTLGYNSSDRITGITNPFGDTTSYQYTSDYSDNMTGMVLPEGNTPYTQTYDESQYPFCAVTSQTDAYSNTTTITTEEGYSYLPTTEHRPDGTQVVYKHQSGERASPLSFEDAEGKKAGFTANSNDRLTTITDRLGDTTSMTYHEPTGFLTSHTNAVGNTLRHSYTARSQTFTNPDNAHEFIFTFHDRTRTDYPDGTYETFGYDTNGNLTNHTDKSGQIRNYTYNSQGLPLTITNPMGGVTTNSYNPDSTLASTTDSDTGTTTYSYDLYKRLTSIDAPGTGRIDMSYDLLDRITSVTNENGNSTHYQYDGNGNLVRLTDQAGNATQYNYDLMDRLTQTVSRTGGTKTVSYNFDNKVTQTIDANGMQTTYAYNTRRLLQSTTRNGKTRNFTWDDEGVSTGGTSPAGHTLQQQTDKLGHLSTVILPGGETTQISRDAMTRVTGSTDPLGRLTQYGYDANGVLSDVTQPDGSSAGYSRDAMGNLTGINDLNGQNWGFTYTPMGRMISAVDPLSRTNSYTHDARGRVATVTYSDGVTRTNSYDNTGNLTRRLYSDGTDLNFSYDAINNLTNCNDLALTRDDAERITGSTYNGETFGVTYDAGGRVATATYGGALTVTYSYNADNLLSWVGDTLGNQVDFTYDADGNPTALTRGNGINAAYTWDSNGRLSHLRDGSFIDLSFDRDAAGQITSARGSWPLDSADFLASAATNHSVDAASQITGSGYAYDARGRATQLPGHTLAWDGAERLTAISNTTSTSTMTYNGLHEIVSRTENSTTTHYHHNHALGFTPIVAEQQGASFTRYYVYTPAGKLLYSIDPQNGNAIAYYHCDQIGSTLALSDSTGTITDHYAYSPFGELLGHTGSSDQPYTFVGTLGVRREGDLYQMRRRYYNPMTARFLSKEPIWPQTDNPRSLNPYQYARASPVQVIDRTGLMLYDCAESLFGPVGAKDIWQAEFAANGLWSREAAQCAAAMIVAIERNPDVDQEKLKAILIAFAKAQANARAWAAHLAALDAKMLSGHREVTSISYGMSMKTRICRRKSMERVTEGVTYYGHEKEHRESRLKVRRLEIMERILFLHQVNVLNRRQ